MDYFRILIFVIAFIKPSLIFIVTIRFVHEAY